MSCSKMSVMGTAWKTKQSSEWFGTVVIHYQFDKASSDIYVQKLELKMPQNKEQLTRIKDISTQMLDAYT